MKMKIIYQTSKACNEQKHFNAKINNNNKRQDFIVKSKCKDLLMIFNRFFKYAHNCEITRNYKAIVIRNTIY